MEFFGGKKRNFFEEKMRLFRLKLDVWVKKVILLEKKRFSVKNLGFCGEKWVKNGDFGEKYPKFGFF